MGLLSSGADSLPILPMVDCWVVKRLGTENVRNTVGK